MKTSKLDEYRQKRDPGRTPEPFGVDEQAHEAKKGAAATLASKRETREGAFVVHLHDARRRHYDVRLEVSGALESFAVPKGPSLDPSERRLAVRTEPHPIEYLDFEAVIPAGNYGAGPMIVWDKGHVRYIGEPAEAQLEKGRLEFELSGHKLHGRFLLVQMKSAEKDWLLFKKHDAFEAKGSDIIQEKPHSVLSGLSVEELSHTCERDEDFAVGKPNLSREVLPAEAPRLQNPNKVLFPEANLNKQDLADYYAAVASVLLPHLADRPVMLVRYPDGIHGKFFYQWNAPQGAAAHARTRRVVLPGRADVVEIFDVRDAKTLLYLVNLAAIPLHVLASHAPSLDCADFLTIDLDVSGGTFANMITLAHTLRHLLDSIGLVGYPKTSGQSGLHVFVPLGPSISYETARTLADLLGHLLAQERPYIATMERLKKNRGQHVYIDTGQTGAFRTIVAPYAVRAVPAATVSTPLGWEEVDEHLDPRAFDVHSVPRRITLRGDPMGNLSHERPNVVLASERLETLVRRGKRVA